MFIKTKYGQFWRIVNVSKIVSVFPVSHDGGGCEIHLSNRDVVPCDESVAEIGELLRLATGNSAALL